MASEGLKKTPAAACHSLLDLLYPCVWGPLMHGSGCLQDGYLRSCAAVLAPGTKGREGLLYGSGFGVWTCLLVRHL